MNALFTRWLLLLSAVLGLAGTGRACCIGDYAGLFPTGTRLATNSVFLLEFSEGDYQLKGKTDLLQFQVVSTRGLPVLLVPVQVNFSGTMGQILLKPTAYYPLHDSVSLRVTYRGSGTVPLKIAFLLRLLQEKKWHVALPADHQQPTWAAQEATCQAQDGSNSSVGGYSVIFTAPVADNSLAVLRRVQFEDVQYALFYEIAFEGARYIAPASFGFTTSIYTSSCGSNFFLYPEGSYQATLRPLDASGNYCATGKTIAFATPRNSGQ